MGSPKQQRQLQAVYCLVHVNGPLSSYTSRLHHFANKREAISWTSKPSDSELHGFSLDFHFPLPSFQTFGHKCGHLPSKHRWILPMPRTISSPMIGAPSAIALNSAPFSLPAAIACENWHYRWHLSSCCTTYLMLQPLPCYWHCWLCVITMHSFIAGDKTIEQCCNRHWLHVVFVTYWNKIFLEHVLPLLHYQ